MRKNKLIVVLFIISISLVSFTNNVITNEIEITNFTLKSTKNKQVSLSSYKNAKGFIVIFTCNKCPMAKFYSDRLNVIYSKYKSKEVHLIALNSMDTLAYAEESFVLMQKKVKEEK